MRQRTDHIGCIGHADILIRRLRPLLVAALAAVACSEHPGDLTGTQGQAIGNGTQDSADPAAATNIVANTADWYVDNSPPGCRIGSYIPCNVRFCSPWFVTPTRMLLANHCITGDADNPNPSSLGSVSIGAPGAPLASGRSTLGLPLLSSLTVNHHPTPIISNSDRYDDVSIIALDATALPTASWLDILRLSIQRPSLVAPTTQLAYSAGFSGSNTRTVAPFPGVSLNPGGMWVYTTTAGGDPYQQGGDSGGPLFYKRSFDNSRDGFGVVSFTQDMGGGNTASFWVDLTSVSEKTWLSAHLTDASANHMPNWNAQHPFPNGTDRWFGEVDYTGACDHTNDPDCDGWYSIHDNCPSTPNPTQADSNDDTIGDACPCPCDPGFQDYDGDGVCAVSCPAHPELKIDNCPSVWNPGQQNCNSDAETRWGLPVLGDVCDSVPCPLAAADTASGAVTGGGTCNYNPQIGGSCASRKIHDLVQTLPLPSTSITGDSKLVSNFFVAQLGVTTSYRFCQHGGSINCAAASSIADSLLSQGESNSLPWHRVRLGDTTCGSTCSFAADSRGQTYAINYGADVSGTIGLDPFQMDYDKTAKFVKTWDFAGDNGFWKGQQPSLIPDPANYPNCNNNSLYGMGTCLDGQIWSHADTTNGDSQHSSVPNPLVLGNPMLSVGSHGDQLANHYFSIRPDQVYTWNLTGTGVWRRILLWKTLPDPWEAFPAITSGVLVANPYGGQLGILHDDGTNAVLSAQEGAAPVSQILQAHLASTSFVWASRVEPNAAIGMIASGVEGVAFSQDGTSNPDIAIMQNGVLVSRAEAGFPDFVTRSGVFHPAPRVGFATFYSSAAGGVFMFGGNDAATGLPLHDAWFRAIGNDWSYLSDVPIDTLLAATYSFADGKLYVLDHGTATGIDVARLRRYDMREGRLEQLGSWPRLTSFSGNSLLVDTDGSVLLVSTSATSSVVGRLAVDATGTAYATTIDPSEPGNLAFDPIVDPGGYAFVTVDANQHWSTARVPALRYGQVGNYPLGGVFFSPIVNGGFEASGGWILTGAFETAVTQGAHAGSHAAMLGATTPTNGDSNISQTFTAPNGTSTLSFWYKMTCPDTVYYDWATATLMDNTTGVQSVVLSKVCTTNGWTPVVGRLVVGHNYTLTLTSHDDNYGADPTYTVYDDVTMN